MNIDKKPCDRGFHKASVHSMEGASRGSPSKQNVGGQNPLLSLFSRIHRWLVPLALAAITLAVYWPVRKHAFINYDDPVYVTENRHVQAGITRQGLAWAFFNLHGEHTYWHPVTWVSHMLDCQLFGLNPGPHHLVNVAFHIANALLVLLVLRRMTGAFWRSAMVAGLFALHPLQVDTVAWVTERKNVLSTLFWLLALWAYVRYVEVQSPKSKVQSVKTETRSPKPGGSGPWSPCHLPSAIFYLLSLSLFAVGLMCKPALVTLPFVLLLLDYWPLGRMPEAGSGITHQASRSALHAPIVPLRSLLLEKLPFLALAAAASFITIAGHHEIRSEGGAGLPWQWRVGNALVSYVRYLGKTFWPNHLAVFYPHPGTWPAWAVGGSALVLLAVTSWVIWRARQAPYLVTGWLWFLGVLVPMIGIIQAGAQAMADRFAYVPLVGLFIMVVWGVADWASCRLEADGCSRRAFPLAAESAPTAVAGYGLLKVPWSQRKTSLTVAGLLALGGCAAVTCRQLSYWQNTTTLFEHALQVTSNNSCAHFSLGNELADEGKIVEAMKEWETALKIEPRRADIQGRIAAALSQRGNYRGAIARYRQALQIDPNHPEVLNNLAWLLATSPQVSLRSGPEAVQLALKACELTRFRRTILVGTLAAAYAEAGRFGEAATTAQRACALASEEGDGALLARNQQLMEIYRAGRAYHETAPRQAEF